MNIYFPRLYRYDRLREHCQVTVPFSKGTLTDCDHVRLIQNGAYVPTQTKVTSRYEDGSIRYLMIHFLADLAGRQETILNLDYTPQGSDDILSSVAFTPISVIKTPSGYEVRSGVDFAVSDDSDSIFDWLNDGRKRYKSGQFKGPYLETADRRQHKIRLKQWKVSESGPLIAVLRCMGEYEPEDFRANTEKVTFETKLTAWAEKPWVEIAFRIINSTESSLHIASLAFGLTADAEAVFDPSLPGAEHRETGDSMGEGADPKAGLTDNSDGLCRVNGIRQLTEIESSIDQHTVRTCAANSNYKTNFLIGQNGASVCKVADAAWLIGEANEHYAEVLYGTFFADRTDGADGVCATIFQAQQNYPKAVKANQSGIYIMLVPKDVNRVVMESGMSREQRFLLHFHAPDESLAELDNRSLIYQMPDRPYIPTQAFQEAGVMPDIFVAPEHVNPRIESAFYTLADNHARCYGMLNWGDAPDPGYTTQGRGKGQNVWTNNEYDYPHACALLYARTGERRFLDYLLAAGSHWMDVDICHYSNNPLHLHGQWEHSRRHCLDSTIVCSHQWVEGLLDYYHFTGDERALETALGIGENVLRLLDTPTYQTSGESTARETGWALRSLSALYTETHDKKWVARCDWIVNQFKEWFDMYGGWISPYTDNTMIRVPFMISVAVGSLMRYYRIFPREDIKTMILAAVDDLIDNCYMKNTDLFFYKELPSLGRLGNNTLVLEALTIAYELSGDSRYLSYGKLTFWNAIDKIVGTIGGVKTIVDDAVIQRGDGTKTFAQSFLPLAVYYKAMTDHHML